MAGPPFYVAASENACGDCREGILVAQDFVWLEKG